MCCLGAAIVFIGACVPAAAPTPTEGAASSPTTGPTAQSTPTPGSPTPTQSVQETIEATPTTASSTPTPTSTPGGDSVTLLASIESGAAPCAMTELGGSMWVTNYRGSSVTQIDGARNEVLGEYEVGGGPCGIASDGEQLWIGLISGGSVVRFDPTALEVTAEIELDGDPWDVQFGHGSVWVAVRQTDDVLRIDPESAEILATIPSTGGIVTGLVVTSTEIWVANLSSAKLTRIDPSSNETVGDIEVEGGPYWMAAGPDSVLVSISDHGRAVLIDAMTAEVVANIDVGTQPRDPGFVDGLFWMPNQSDASVSLIDPATAEVVDTLKVPDVAGIFVIDGFLGDAWILDFQGTHTLRVAPQP